MAITPVDDGALTHASAEEIGRALLERHVIDPDQLAYALAFHRAMVARGSSTTLPDLLVRYNFASPRILQTALEDCGIRMNFSGAEADLQRALATVRLTGNTVRFVSFKAGVLSVTSTQPLPESSIQLLLDGARDAGIAVKQIERLGSDVSETLELARNSGAGAGDIDMRLRQMQRDTTGVEQAAVSQLVSDLFFDALERRATDIHLNCAETEAEARIEYRVDRDLVLSFPVTPAFLHRICAVVRERANIDTEDVRSNFDGRLTFQFQGRQIEARLSAAPQLGGQIIVMRLNDPTNMRTTREVYGAYPQILAEAENFCHDAGRQGQIGVLSGAVNTGKSTALRAMLMHMPRHRRRITAIEDPVEQRIPFVVHKQVDTRPGGLGYVDHLRQTLREDVDVVAVGEIRDGESLSYALRVPDAGNTLITTVHADDAPSTLRRLMLLAAQGAARQEAANVLGLHMRLVVNQALTTTVCEYCGTRVQVRALPSHQQDVLQRYGLGATMEIAHPREGGCTRCEHRGYRGRVLLPDALVVAPEARATLAESLADLSLFARLQQGELIEGMIWHRRPDFVAQMVRERRLDAATAVPLLSQALESVQPRSTVIS